MKIWYDLEFHEDGARRPIDFISIGMVREDGVEYYAINRNAMWHAIFKNEWLRANVLPHLPGKIDDFYNGGGSFVPDESTGLFRSREQIALDVREFTKIKLKKDQKAELYAWYADYDHVVMCQLFGKMIDLPAHMPMYTRDVKQMVDMLKPDLLFDPAPGPEHDALEDARDCREKWLKLKEYVGLNEYLSEVIL
jgi:3' exoribonuclease, RNase T-like